MTNRRSEQLFRATDQLGQLRPRSDWMDLRFPLQGSVLGLECAEGSASMCWKASVAIFGASGANSDWRGFRHVSWLIGGESGRCTMRGTDQ
jgi:hypothetical protein